VTTLAVPNFAQLTLIFVASVVGCSGLIGLLRPFWRHYALAKPNLRSSHAAPTPQGGGIVVIVVVIVAMLVTMLMPSVYGNALHLVLVIAAVILLAIVGAIDDVRIIEVVPRLLAQTIAVIIVVASLPTELHVVSFLPWSIERLLLVIGGVWFVNVVNFMDGIDWMTVAEVVPLTASLALFGLTGALPPNATVVSLALCGAMIGFAPFNRPVARLFLGDVGSLPIGLLIGWLLTELAGRGHLIAAVLLPLYYLADTAITILRRLVNGEQITKAHRSHFYQRAMDGGLSVKQIILSVFVVNIMLVGLAVITFAIASIALQFVTLAVGSALVGTLLNKFNRR